jgi:uncharacterized protein (DUF2342 family)
MTTAELTIVIPLYVGAAGLLIDRVFDAFRRLKREQAEDLFRASVAARGLHVDGKLVEIKTQTNGNTEKLQNALSASLIEIGRLQGMVTGLQTARAPARATDAVLGTAAPPAVAPTP